MDLIKYLREDVWMTSSSEKVSGLTMYTVVRNDRGQQPGTFKYAIKEVREDGALALVTLDGAKGDVDPLDRVRNVELRISADDQLITAVNLDGDCVVRIK